MVGRGLGDPAGDFIGRLMSPQAAEKLRLDKDQMARLREVVGRHHEKLAHLRERMSRAVKGAKGKLPSEKLEAMAHGAQQRIKELTGELRQRIAEVLRPDQREAVERLLRPHKGKPKPHEEKRRPKEPEKHKERDL